MGRVKEQFMYWYEKQESKNLPSLPAFEDLTSEDYDRAMEEIHTERMEKIKNLLNERSK